MKVSFTCFARPEPQGSTRAFIPKGWNRAVITSANPKMKGYRAAVSGAAMDACAEQGFVLVARPGAVLMRVQFYFLKPKSAKRSRHVTRPDCDKLLRSTFDSLTGILYDDDSQIVTIEAQKHYGAPERAEIEVETVDEIPQGPTDGGRAKKSKAKKEKEAVTAGTVLG